MACGFGHNYKSDDDGEFNIECEEVQCDGCDEVCDGGSLGVIAKGENIKGGSFDFTNTFIGGEIFKFTLIYKIKNNESPFTVVNRNNVVCRHIKLHMNPYRDIYDLRLCEECNDEIIIQSPFIYGMKNQLQKKTNGNIYQRENILCLF